MAVTLTATRDSHYCTCLGQIGRHDTDRIISIDQGKWLSLTFLHTNFASVHEPLGTNVKSLSDAISIQKF